ncbi:Sialin [Chionoecetes opilio]|uniref:Sialin n=1 Tax=Chionoecetes opilio TaxID=41210 RepID=A0A8J4XYB1_CHIOP|nr:Sialin [Chionoecetes opilio]
MLRQEGAGNRTLVTPWEDGDEMRGQEEEEGFDWDEMTQGLVLAGFFYGYIFTQIIGGRLAEVYGTRLTFGLCGVTSGFFTLLSPIAARTHYGAFIAVRVLMGFFQGPMWPSMHALVPRWIPPLERARFISVVYLASSLSMMLTMAFTGVVIDFFGWEAAFYIPGTICLLWALCWFVLVADSPSQHPRISLKEKQYIESCVRKSGTSSKRPKKIPWCAILSCIPFWAIVVIDAGNVFGLSIFFTHLPTYMKNVLGFSIKENGFLSSLPFLFRYIGGLCFSTLGDWLLSSGRISVITCRRVSSVAAMIVPALLCIATAYSGCSATLAITFLCIVTFNNGAVVNTSMVNLVDIAPNFSGTIYGLSNTVEAITMFLSPICVAAIIQGQYAVILLVAMIKSDEGKYSLGLGQDKLAITKFFSNIRMANVAPVAKVFWIGRALLHIARESSIYSSVRFGAALGLNGGLEEWQRGDLAPQSGGRVKRTSRLMKTAIGIRIIHICFIYNT